METKSKEHHVLLKRLRNSLWFTQEEFANELWIPRPTYAFMERWDTLIHLNLYLQLQDKYGFNLTDTVSANKIRFEVTDYSGDKITVYIPMSEWKEYYDKSTKLYIEKEKTWDYTNMYDIDECQELWVISQWHLSHFLSLKKKRL